MGRRLALGLGEPMFAPIQWPSGQRRWPARRGEALASNREVADRADVVVLCHKPAQLEQVAADIAGNTKAVLSILGGAPWTIWRRRCPRGPSPRAMPNVAAEPAAG